MSIITLNTRSLPDSAVTTAKIAADAVTDAKIADDVVGTEHLTAGEVDATALGADSVTAAKINNDIISGSTELASEPADTDEFLVSDAGTLKRIDYSLIKGGGITVADQWRYTGGTSFSTEDTIDANLERVDTTGQGQIGSAMTESSGIFTFPSTGIYYVTFMTNCYISSADTRVLYNLISVTTDNSSYSDHSRAYSSIKHISGATYGYAATSSLIDVTDTSNVKVRFRFYSDNAVVVQGNTDKNFTHMTFIRLGDT